MFPEIAGYNVDGLVARYFSSSLYQASSVSDGRAVLIKTLTAAFPDRRDIKRLEREFWVLNDFSGARGVMPVSDIRTLENGNRAIISDGSGQPLSQFLSSGASQDWSLERKVLIAVGLAEALDAVHARKMVHKNVAPQNILIDPQTWIVRLMNFEIATSLTHEHQDRSLSKRLEGSLPYISPEQTGRMSNDLDHRSDFYSLGVVIFELLFGKLPFKAQSQLEWVHAHIGKLPDFPAPNEQSLPPQLLDIVRRLLEKSPETRYQSCFGLLQDLYECHRQLARTGRIEPFVLGQRDVSEVFCIPQQLFGREAELARLRALFDTVVRGGSEICMISGTAGVGKSAIVDALDKNFFSANGYFLCGKFDQFERAKPYAGISAAFAGLVQNLLTESAETLADWRTDMLEVLGGNAQVLIDVIPELETVFGPQPAASALPPTEAQNRLQITFVNFVRHLSARGRPLILYIDDLQWSDGPTLNLLGRLATARDIGHLFIIGSLRDNEVDKNHQFSLMRDDIAKDRTVHDVILGPLNREAVGEIVAGAVRTVPEQVDDLSDLIYRQTEGNPFFVTELLKTFVDESHIQFDRKTGHWTWDFDAISKAKLSDDIVEFLIGNLGKLPSDTQEALRFAACIGHEFDLKMLSVVHQRSYGDLGLALMSALERNVILPLDEGYQLFDAAAIKASTSLDLSVNPRFRFLHDRLHQAAYELIDDKNKQRVHLKIGRLLQQNAGSTPDDEQTVKITSHLNEACELIESGAEKEALARLNLRSAQIAHDASSYHSGLHYLRTARALLPQDAWASHYVLTKDIALLFAQTVYLNGLHEEADSELNTVLEYAHSALEKAQVLSMRTRHYSTLGRMQDSIEAALQGLQLLGIDISNNVDDSVVENEIRAIAENLGGREVADLINAPRMSDPEISAAVGLLMEIFPPAFLSGAGKLFHLLVLKSVNLSLRYGNSTETAFAFAAYGMLLCGTLNQPAKGNEYGKLALAMNDSFEDIGLKSRIIYVYTMFNHHWSHPWSSMTDLFKQGIESGYQSGDLLYLAYNAQDCIIWDPTLDLDTAIAQQTKYLEIVKDCNYADSYDSASLFLQMLLNFAGQTEGNYALGDENFDEAARLEGMRERGFITGVANYNIYKAEIHCLYRDFEGALPFVQDQEALCASVMSLPQLVRFRFLAFLTYANQETPADATQAAFMTEHVEQMVRWAQNCPQNFSHLEMAMRAEQNRLSGNLLMAFEGYETAARIAGENGFLRDRAMIHELCMQAYRDAGLAGAADGNLRAARNCYQRWGATRKLEMLDDGASSQTGALRIANAPTDAATFDKTGAITHDALDLASVMEAARAISSEIKLDALLSRTMKILLESTGAQRGVMVSKEGNHYAIEMEQKVDLGPVDAGATLAESVPLSVVNYVLRTRRPLVLDDASASTNFSNDPYVTARGTRSVLCAPIVRAEHFEGVIYLENDLAPGAFPEERVALVDLLAAQASISMENAKLYVGLEQKVQERTIELVQKSTALEAVANQMSKYLSPQLYRSIFDQQKEVRLTTERKRLTVFFSDLVGFTETVDRMESDDLTAFLNQYLSEMAELAIAHGATIDKFVGDAIVIFFGDPETRGEPEDALACVNMAIAMRKRLNVLRREWLAAGMEKPWRVRMGIHTGTCTVGNFGSEARMDYTMVGGSVNLASRLEGAANPGAILISDATYSHIKDRINCSEHGEIQMKGISRPVQTYEVIDAFGPDDRALSSEQQSGAALGKFLN